jgi:hypothetical protein
MTSNWASKVQSVSEVVNESKLQFLGAFRMDRNELSALKAKFWGIFFDISLIAYGLVWKECKRFFLTTLILKFPSTQRCVCVTFSGHICGVFFSNAIFCFWGMQLFGTSAFSASMSLDRYLVRSLSTYFLNLSFDLSSLSHPVSPCPTFSRLILLCSFIYFKKSPKILLSMP